MELLEPQNFAKDRWMEVIEFRKNFAWFCANTCDILNQYVCEEDLKQLSLLLGNEEDAKGLLNIN